MKKPKKISKKKTKKNEEKHKEETELEEEVKEAEKAITHRLRETLNDKEKEIEKEQETEQQSEFFEPVRQIPLTEVKAPVLERIIETQPEQQITPLQDFTDTTSRTEREERRIDYSAQNQPNYGFQRNTREENEEKKYESTFVPPVLSTREIFRQEMKQEFLHPQQEVQSQRAEESLENIEILEQGIKLPFEQEQRKYKRHKLR